MTEDRLHKILQEFDRKRNSIRNIISDKKIIRIEDNDPTFLYKIDAVFVCESGAMFVTGWIDDRTSAVERVELKGSAWSRGIEGRQLGRARRSEADAALGNETGALHGFFALTSIEPELVKEEGCAVELVLADGRRAAGSASFQRTTTADLKHRLARFLTELRQGDHRLPEDVSHMERMMRLPAPPVTRPVPRHTIENVSIAEGGGVFVTGWINDTADELSEIRISAGHWRVALPGDGLARNGREDVQAALGLARRHAFGFWGLVSDPSVAAVAHHCVCEVVMKSGAIERHELPLNVLFDQVELRNLALTYLASSRYLGNPALESVASLERFLGRQIVDLNVLISRAIASRPHVERFGRQDRQKKGSIVVCLYGRAEYLTLQAALFSARKGIDDYEFVYVSNSPELTEQLIRDARIATRAYGLDITLVLLPGNAGFGAANNAAVAFSRTDRPLIVNPDVFPFDPDWAAKHTAIVEGLPEERTRLFGAPLYYDDGSLMHGGMYFDSDVAISIEGSRFRPTATLRVEHYGKGAPPLQAEFLKARPVPAVTGAFISCDRAWYETLYGFSEEYVLGHYEDADLCLKSLEAGVAPWMHDLKLWHIEGKGSGQRQPHHEGASIVNRWLFNRRWAATIVPDLIGQAPAHPLLNPERQSPPIALSLTPANDPGPAPLRRAKLPKAPKARKGENGRGDTAGRRKEIVFGAEP